MRFPGRQFFLFCVVGTAGFLVDVAVLYALVQWLGWYGARGLSFLAAVVTTWLLNRRFTFGASRSAQPVAPLRTTSAEFLTYLVSMLAGAAVNYAAFVAVTLVLRGPWVGMVGVAAGSIAGLSVNYFAARAIVFRNGN